ncbi:MAG: ATP-binding cassette domain-containing protein [Patescibacteria group bacterium]
MTTANHVEKRGALLTVSDVSLTLGGNIILHGVNCQVEDFVGHGQVVGFLGPSGIGKSQFLRILAGLNKPDTGSVLVTEKQVPVEVGMVGVVAQHYPLFEHKSVLGNLTFAARRAGSKRAEAREKAMAMLKRFGLTDRKDFWPAQLSGGQRQRVAIAQQLLCSEHFILMDEPFSGLDPIVLDEVCKLIKETADAHELNTIIVVTHDVDAAVAVADTLWLMGRDHDQEGNIIPGARIKTKYDLVERGLAWRPDVVYTADFSDCVREVRKQFWSL